MCSRKWLMPFPSGGSKRDPIRICASITERCTCGMGTASSRSPLVKIERCGASSDSSKGYSGIVCGGLVVEEAVVDGDFLLARLAQASHVRAERLRLRPLLHLAHEVGLFL